PAPLLQIAEGVLRRAEDVLEHREPALLARLPRIALRFSDVDRDPAAHPRTTDAGQQEQAGEQDEEGDHDGDAEWAARAIRVLGEDLGRIGRSRRGAGKRDRVLRGALADD